jgi:hypothetical protein
MTELETVVRAKLASAVDAAPEPVAVAAVERKVRTRRRRVTGLAAAVGVMAVAIPSVIVAAHDGTTSANPPTTRSTSDHDPDEMVGGIPPPGQLGTLPLGDAPHVPWTFDLTLRQGADSVQVPGTGNPDLIGKVDGGWFLLVEYYLTHPYSFETRYGILHADGSFMRLPNLSSADRPYVQEATVSPDGSQVAGHAIVDVHTGDVVATLPKPADYMVGWGQPGIVYDVDYGPKAGSWLWLPGREPTRLARHIVDVEPGTSRVVTTAPGPCTEVSDLSRDGVLTPLWRGCGSHVTVLISPDGARALTGDLSIVDLDSGAVSTLPLPDNHPHGRYRAIWFRAVWEDSTHLLLPVDGRWLVRCDVTTFACERAAGPLRITTHHDINFVGRN